MAISETLENGILETLTPQEVARLFDQGKIVLIDVRTPVEYAFEQIKGALLAPMASLEVRHLPSQCDKNIVLHCGSGKRSRMVAEKYLAAGYGKVAHMEGGMGSWKRNGLSYLATNLMTGALAERRDEVVA